MRGLMIVVGTVWLASSSCVRDTARQVPARDDSAHECRTQPFFEYRSHQVGYAGPGLEDDVPADIEKVRIGWFGPPDTNDPSAGMMWSAALMAVDEANRAGGYDGKPFELVAAWSVNPWGTGVRDVVRLVYDEEAWAIVGAPDSPSAHLAEQVVAKARLPLLSCVATDKSANLVNVPWMFTLVPGDHLIAPPMAAAIDEASGQRPFVLLSASDHDSRMTTTELLAALKRRDRAPSRHVVFSPQEQAFVRQRAAISDVEPAAVVVIGDASASARCVKAVRSLDSEIPIFCGPRAGQRAFRQQAGEAAHGVRYPAVWNVEAGGERARSFVRQFSRRTGAEPDYTAAYTFDAMCMLISAIETTGLNRVRISERIRDLAPYDGVTGPVIWDPTGHNTGSGEIAIDEMP